MVRPVVRTRPLAGRRALGVAAAATVFRLELRVDAVRAAVLTPLDLGSGSRRAIALRGRAVHRPPRSGTRCKGRASLRSSLAFDLPLLPSSEEGTVKMKIALVFAAFAMLAGASVLSAQSPQSLTMTNAEVVSVDPAQRTMVIRNTQGKNQTVELDDQLAGMGGIRAGDKVVLSLRKGPGRDRV